MEQAILVTVDFGRRDSWEPEESSRELVELTRSSGGFVVEEVILHREKPTPNLFIGKGKVEELHTLCVEKGINTVIFNDDLSGTQQRNLEEALGVKTIDRTQLILDIFAQHARSLEGKIQVELAQLEYLLPRLTGRGIFLSRLGGGIGTRGPGERKLEVDRRRIRKRITKLKEELESLRLRRQALRRKREDFFLPSIAIIGYTNAGKSTLMNALTDSHQMVRQSLFTTLDSLARRFILPNNQRVIFLDTVGFLNRLPHRLIEAFKATLEEVTEADILLHVLDVSHPKAKEQAEAVYEVLSQINAMNKPIVTALNKIDKLESDFILERFKRNFPNSVAISALKRQHIDKIVEKIEKELSGSMTRIDLVIPLDKMNLVNIIYNEGKMIKCEYREKEVHVEADLPLVTARKILSLIQNGKNYQ